MNPRVLYNTMRASAHAFRGADDDPRRFHRSIPGYAPTPLVDLPELAADVGLARVLAKNEHSRLGLPSFKVVGASWAVRLAILDHLERDPAADITFADLRNVVAGTALRLTAATDGNHGRAVARIARLLGVPCRIFVPENMVPARVAAIEGEGAVVVIVHDAYDATVAYSAEDAARDPNAVLVSDTSWEGYQRIPQAVVAGYQTIMSEISEQLTKQGAALPNLTVVPMGVGSFAASVLDDLRRRDRPSDLRVIGVEPTDAACVMASLSAERRLSIGGPLDSIMAGLNCGTPSLDAWPVLAAGLDVTVAVSDDHARDGMRDLARDDVVGGECAGAGPAALRALLTGPDADFHRRKLEVDRESTALIFVTEGATDPDAYKEIVGSGVKRSGHAHRSRV